MFNKILLYIDVILLNLLSVIAVTSVNESVLVFFCTLTMMFFSPGYFLLISLYPNNESFGYYRKYIVSFGVSIVITGLFCLIIIYSFGFNSDRISISLMLLIFVLSVFAGIRKKTHSKDIFIDTKLIFDKIGQVHFWTWIKGLAIVLTSFIYFGFLLTTNARGPEYTEFYIVGDEGLAADYPSEVVVGIPFQVTVGLVNHEEKNITYAIFAMVEDEPVGVLYPFEVYSGERREDDLSITLSRVEEDQKIDIILGVDDFEYPYRKLTLWVDVVD